MSHSLFSKNNISLTLATLAFSTSPIEANEQPIDCTTGEPQTINTTATCLLRKLSELRKSDTDLFQTTEHARNIAEKADSELNQANYSKAYMLYSSANGLKPSYDRAVAGAECNTVIELKLEHHAA